MAVAMDLKLRACPRCKGDIYKGEDEYGTYWECIQCGYVEYEKGKEVEDEEDISCAP